MTPRKPKAAPEPVLDDAPEATEPAANTQSWDAFWAEQDAEDSTKTELICGVQVQAPTDMTLKFQRKLDDLSDSTSADDVESLVAELFGAGTYEQWVENGMKQRQFRTALAWGYACAKGKQLTFREAFDVMVEAERRQGNPEAANRADRRAASKGRSKSTGGPSKPTSAAATTSSRRKSPSSRSGSSTP